MNNYELGQIKWRENLEKRRKNHVSKPPSELRKKRQFCKEWVEQWGAVAEEYAEKRKNPARVVPYRCLSWNAGKQGLRAFLERLPVYNGIICSGNAGDWATIEGYLPGYGRTHNKRFIWWWDKENHRGIIKRLQTVDELRDEERQYKDDLFKSWSKQWFFTHGVAEDRQDLFIVAAGMSHTMRQ